MEELGKFPVLASFAAGTLTFVSPCVLPLIPAFVSFITGTSIENLRGRKTSFVSTFFKSLVFILGFSAVFIIFGLSASRLGGLLIEYRDWLRYAGGTVVIILGIHITGLVRIKFLYRQVSISVKIKYGTAWISTFFVGAAFALGWTPCIGPVLASILILASTQENVRSGFWLLTVYSLGLAVPFMLTSLFIDRFLKFFNFIKNYYKIIEIISGILLAVIGILIITDGMTKITQFLLRMGSN